MAHNQLPEIERLDGEDEPDTRVEVMARGLLAIERLHPQTKDPEFFAALDLAYEWWVGAGRPELYPKPCVCVSRPDCPVHGARPTAAS